PQQCKLSGSGVQGEVVCAGCAAASLSFQSASAGWAAVRGRVSNLSDHIFLQGPQCSRFSSKPQDDAPRWRLEGGPCSFLSCDTANQADRLCIDDTWGRGHSDGSGTRNLSFSSGCGPHSNQRPVGEI